MKASDQIIDALVRLGDGNLPCTEVVSGCDFFLCLLTSTKDVSGNDAGNLRWKKFKRLKNSDG